MVLRVLLELTFADWFGAGKASKSSEPLGQMFMRWQNVQISKTQKTA